MAEVPAETDESTTNAVDSTFNPVVAPVCNNVVFATSGYDQTIKFWDPLTGACTRTITYPESHVNCMSVSIDKSYLLVGSNPNCRIFDVKSQNNTPVLALQGHTANVTTIGFPKDFKWLFSASEDKSVKIWDSRTPKCQRSYQNKAPINFATLHPNQAEILTVDQNGSLKIWDLVSNSCTQELIPEEGVAMQSVAISADGSHVAVCNYSGNCYIWQISNGYECTELQPAAVIKAHESYVTKVLISSDSRKLATSSADGLIKIWSLKDFSLTRSIEGHQKWIWDISFSADSAYIVSASSDQTAKLWDAENGDLIRTYSGHEKAITTLALNDYAADD